MSRYRPTGVPIALASITYPVDKNALTQATLQALLHYDPSTGVFTRRHTYNRWKAGEPAGTVRRNGDKLYVQVRVGGFIYAAGRLAWLYMTGAWPQHEVDHINGDSIDNRWENLRDATPRMNVENQRRAPKGKKYSPLLGAHWDRITGRWKSSIQVRGVSRHIGTFDTDVEAHEAYVQAKRRLHEGCTI